jgi:hypothetical protein
VKDRDAGKARALLITGIVLTVIYAILIAAAQQQGYYYY